MSLSHQHEEPTILIVDDDVAVCLLMQTALKHAGYIADSAGNGLLALEKSKSNNL